MSHRRIVQLQWAEEASRPAGLPIGRPRGAKRAGVNYEKALASALPGARHGQWFRFCDSGGLGHCQVDLLVDLGLRLLVLEAKYTWTPTGHTQIEQLYRPVLERVYGKPVLAVQVCKKLVPEASTISRIATSLPEAVDLACGDARVTLHWIGVGSLALAAGLQPCLSGRAPRNDAELVGGPPLG